MVLGIYVIWHDGAEPTDHPEDVAIIIQEVEVVNDLGDMANGCVVQFNLTYNLNLSCPKDVKYTFEFPQKVLMDLDSNKLSTKVHVLKNRLYE